MFRKFRHFVRRTIGGQISLIVREGCSRRSDRKVQGWGATGSDMVATVDYHSSGGGV